MTTSQAVFVVTLVILVGGVFGEQDKIKWIPSREFNTGITIPAGYQRTNGSTEQFSNFYVARLRNDTNWIPGKYWPGKKICIAGLDDKEVEKPEADCQLLIFPKGTTSWVYSNIKEKLPQDMIRGGGIRSTARTSPLYLCRARKEGQVLLGWINTQASPKHCCTSLNGVQYKHREYEVLTQNFLAIVTKTVIET